METISLELSKRLEPYLKDTEYTYNVYLDGEGKEKAVNMYKTTTMCDMYNDPMYYKNYKTLTLGEAIEFLPETVKRKNEEFNIKIEKQEKEYCISYYYMDREDEEILYCERGKTLLEAIEAVLTYLLDNNLLN